MLEPVAAARAGGPVDADEMHWLTGPLVVHQSAWNDTLPRWWHTQAIDERRQIVAGEMPGHIVGPTEMMCVMYGAMMEAPRHRSTSDLYLWAATKACVSHFGLQSSSARAALKNCGEHLRDEDVIHPQGRLYHEYVSFAWDIRRKVAKCHREQIKRLRRSPGKSACSNVQNREMLSR